MNSIQTVWKVTQRVISRLFIHRALMALVLVSFCCFVNLHAQSYTVVADSLQIPTAYTILEVKEMYLQKDTIRMGEFMAIKFRPGDSIEKINTLFLDGMEVKTKPWKINSATQTIFYKIDATIQKLVVRLLASKSPQGDCIKLPVSVSDGKHLSNSNSALCFATRQNSKITWIWLVFLLVPLIFFVYASATFWCSPKLIRTTFFL
jgi:hypothetical protein